MPPNLQPANQSLNKKENSNITTWKPSLSEVPQRYKTERFGQVFFKPQTTHLKAYISHPASLGKNTYKQFTLSQKQFMQVILQLTALADSSCI